MKKILINIAIVLIISIIFFFVSINFIFKIPSPTGIGYTEITYRVGIGVAILAGIITSIILYYKNKKSNTK